MFPICSPVGQRNVVLGGAYSIGRSQVSIVGNIGGLIPLGCRLRLQRFGIAVAGTRHAQSSRRGIERVFGKD